MSAAVDIDIDWNEEDDTGLAWTFLDRALDPSKIAPGAYVILAAGRPSPSARLSTSMKLALFISGPCRDRFRRTRASWRGRRSSPNARSAG